MARKPATHTVPGRRRLGDQVEGAQLAGAKFATKSETEAAGRARAKRASPSTSATFVTAGSVNGEVTAMTRTRRTAETVDVKVGTLVVDSVNPRLAAEFWSQALDWHTVDVNEEGAIEIRSRRQTDLSLLFEPSAQPKVTKRRIHFIPRQDEQATELRRLLDLGARQIEVEQGDLSWIVLADPDGNEFCLLRESLEEPRQA